MKKYLFLFLAIILSSCSSDDVNYDAANDAEIKKYISDNNLDAKKSDSGLYYVINNEGTGSKPNVNSNVTVNYKGYYTNGKVFDQSIKDITFNLQQVIRGWTEGITYFKEGGEGILLIPSKLGYGNHGFRAIPGGAVLIFDIKLLKVN